MPLITHVLGGARTRRATCPWQCGLWPRRSLYLSSVKRQYIVCMYRVCKACKYVRQCNVSVVLINYVTLVTYLSNKNNAELC